MAAAPNPSRDERSNLRDGGTLELSERDARRFLNDDAAEPADALRRAAERHGSSLNRRVPLRPIRTDEALARANAVIAALLGRGDLDPAEEDYLDVLGDLVAKYEDQAHPLPNVSGEEVLRHLLDARGLTQAELARGAGIAEPTISAILAGRRRLNRRHIAALAEHLKVDAAVFLPPVPRGSGGKQRTANSAQHKAHYRTQGYGLSGHDRPSIARGICVRRSRPRSRTQDFRRVVPIRLCFGDAVRPAGPETPSTSRLHRR